MGDKLRNYPASTSILVICVITFVLYSFLVLIFSGIFNSTQILYLMGGENAASIFSGELWRFVLPAFLHADVIHIIINMYALWQIGYFIEMYYGSKATFVFFLISSIGGSLLSVGINILESLVLNQDTFLYVSVGASAGLFGLMGIVIGNKFKKDTYSANLPIDENSVYLMVVFNIVYGFIAVGINNWAHIGGLITGIVLGFLIRPIHNFGNKENNKKIINVLFILCIILIVVSLAAHILNLTIIGIE